MRYRDSKKQVMDRTRRQAFRLLRNPVHCAAAAVLGLTPGCFKVDTNGTDSLPVTARVKNPAVSVQASSLVTSVSGSFDLTISVGKSSDESAVFADPPSFELVTAQGGMGIIPLDAELDEDPFPLTIAPGKSTTLSYTLSKRNTVSSEQLATLCSGPVAIVAVLSDPNGTTAESSATSTTGCF